MVTSLTIMVASYPPYRWSNGLIGRLLSLAIFLSPTLASLNNVSVDSVCSTLSKLLPDKVFFPNTTLYTASKQSYFFRESRLSPNCVVSPTSVEDVSRAVRILTASPSVQFAIRGGGHSINKGASNIDSGITVDLSGLNAINPQDGTWDVVEVGPGVRSVEVYRVLDVLNRTVVGARVGSVGLAGFLTGGKSPCP
jgi:FAD/FMN-containing dehydrogenase